MNQLERQIRQVLQEQGIVPTDQQVRQIAQNIQQVMGASADTMSYGQVEAAVGSVFGMSGVEGTADQTAAPSTSPTQEAPPDPVSGSPLLGITPGVDLTDEQMTELKLLENQDYAAFQALMESLEEEQRETYQAWKADPENIERFLAEAERRQRIQLLEARLSWMFEPDGGGLVGLSLPQVDLEEMYDLAVEMFPDLAGNLQSGQGDTEDAVFKEQKMLELLSAGDTLLNRELVAAWGELNDVWNPHTLVNGFPLTTITNIRDQLGVSHTAAVRAAMAAKRHGLDPQVAARLVAIGKERGFLGDDAAAVSERRTQRMVRTAQGFRPADGGPVRLPEPGDRIQDVEGHGLRGSYLSGSEEALRRASVYMSQFSDQPLVAAVAVYIEPYLAEKMYNRPEDLTGDEIAEVKKLAEQLGLDVPGVEFQYNWLTQLGMTNKTVTIDKAGIREAARTIAGAWNMAGVSDGFLDRMIGEFGAKAREAYRNQMGNPFNPHDYQPGRVDVVDSPGSTEASMKERMRGLPEYRELFSKMPAGQTEEEYAAQFDTASQRTVGREDMTAIRAGMRSGDVNTVSQNVLATGAGFDSSTFMGRLAQLRQAYKAST